METTIEHFERDIKILKWMIPLFICCLGMVLLFFADLLYVVAGIAILAGIIASSSPMIRLMILVILLPFSHAGLGLDALPGFGIYNLYAGFVIILFAFRFVHKELFTHVQLPVFGMGFIMLLAFVPSLLHSYDYSESAIAFMNLTANLLTAAALFWILIYFKNIHKKTVILLTLFSAVAAAASVYGIYTSLTVGSLFTLFTGRTFLEIFGNVNYYSSYLLMGLAVSLPMIYLKTGFVSKLIYVFSSTALAIGVIATVSRSALIGFVVLTFMFAIFLFMYQKGTRKYLSVIAVLLFLGLVGLLAFTDIAGEVVDLLVVSQRVGAIAEGEDASLAQRINILHVAGNLIRENWIIGVGFGAFEQAFGAYQDALLTTGFDRSAHNTAVRIMGETGIIGLIPGLIFIYVLLRYTYLGITRARGHDERIIAFSIFSSIFIFLLMALFIDMMFEPHFWIIAALGVAYNYSQKQKVENG